MNFKISKKEFIEALNLCTRAISSTTPLPALNGIKLIVSKNSLNLISSDSNISISYLIDNTNDSNTLVVQEEGEIVLDAKYINEIVRRIDGEMVNVEIIDGELVKIYNGSTEYKINGINAFEYPQISFETSGKPFILKTAVLNEIIEQTIFACSDKETRPVLTGINFVATGKEMMVNATDSYRLAYKKVLLDEEMDFNITVPAKYLNNLYHSISNEKEITIVIDSQKVTFKFNNVIMQTRLLDDAFPDTKRLIPSSFTNILTISSHEFLKAVEKTSFIKSDGKNIVKLSISSEKVMISSLNQMTSFKGEATPLNYEGNPIEISCSGKYLEDAVKALKSEIIRVCFSGELKPIIIKCSDEENVIQLISPVRTYH